MPTLTLLVTKISFSFKNPSKEYFTFKIFSISGSEILSTSTSNEIININISQFTNGLYLYTIESESSFGKGKFVKE
ncbi:MAG: T9SS type A sorting domain-containing protein [Bacteroidetes bacterium]|nr:T9SS type A sorting domain-containing protein [Bacteroidota bacterium]